VVVQRYDDTIDVQMHGDEDQAGRQPAAFVWRDRLYVVRAVQTRWYERRAWWREAAAAALLGLRGDEPRSEGVSGDVSGSGGSVEATSEVPSAGAVAPPGSYLDGETEIWRVEAAAGRSHPVGVFDLARSVPAAASAGASSGWRLTRVAAD
jgi:hypothetical protein